ncbi:MAG: hybrid sensor histidine kinase/response regulator [Steroidobacterales bacterium]
MSARDLSELSMHELFRLDAESQIQALTNGLLALERNPTAAEQLEVCMRAAHSLKGAARIIGLDIGVSVTHAMEDCFVAAQRGAIVLRQPQIDVLLRALDLLNRIANTSETELGALPRGKDSELGGMLGALTEVLQGRVQPEPAVAVVALPPTAPITEPRPPAAAEEHGSAERVLRVSADNLNRLLGLAGESRVESRRLKSFAESMLRLKRLHDKAGKTLESLRDVLSQQAAHSQSEALLADAHHSLHHCRQLLAQRFTEIELFDSRSTNLAHRLYEAALACRMRPFADGIRAFSRMVRDLGRSLGKQVRLEIVGEATQVDRDILDKLDAPLGHLLRNAIDHGIESPDERRAAGKDTEGVIRLEARHSAGLLQIIATDDGRGIDPVGLRAAIVARKLTTAETAGKLSEVELLEFLFLPGFSLKEDVTEISGRGVGLDVVQNMIKQVRGTIRVTSVLGQGARFQLQLPLTLSVVRTLLVEIGGEAYAVPLAHIVRTLNLPKRAISALEGRQYFQFEGRSIGLVSARQVLGVSEPQSVDEDLAVIILGEPGSAYGLVLDRFLGERELVVQPLDARLGKIKDIAAGALLEDGSPVLIVDVEDMLRSVERIVATGRLESVQRGAETDHRKARKRVLVVDDSLTVRELERKLLDHGGYEVDVAVDGMDGWNAVRTGHFDLVVTDIDMPRMDGIELLTLIKKDLNLKSLPVMIVSYKDRPEDRRRGLEAGADYYLTKSSFQDETLLRAAVDLIGAADA